MKEHGHKPEQNSQYGVYKIINKASFIKIKNDPSYLKLYKGVSFYSLTYQNYQI